MQSMLLYLIPASNQLALTPVERLSQAQAIVDALNPEKVSGVRIRYFSESEGCEVVTHTLNQ